MPVFVTEQAPQHSWACAVVAQAAVIHPTVGTALDAVGEERRFTFPAGRAQRTDAIEASGDVQALSASGAWLPLSTARTTKGLPDVGAGMYRLELLATTTYLFDSLLADARAAQRLSTANAMALSYPPTGTAGRGWRPIAASTQLHVTLAMRDEVVSAALTAALVIHRILLNTCRAETIAGPVAIGQLTFPAASGALPAAVAVAPTAVAAPHAI